MSLKGWLLKQIRKRKEVFDPKKVKRVLVIRNARIGDAICAFPLLREIKKAYPHFEIDIFATIHCDFLFEKLPYVNKVFIKYKKRQFIKTWIEILKMKFRNYDLVIDAMPLRFGQSMTILFLNPKWIIGLGVEKRYGIEKKEISFYDKVYTPDVGKEHMVEELCGLLYLINIEHFDTTMEFPKDYEKSKRAEQFIHSVKSNIIIGLNVDASSLTRNLYEKQIVEIIKGLNDYKIILLSLPQRRLELESIISKYKLLNCQLSYQTDSIFDVAELMRVFTLVITPDTSIIHIASAINTPIVGIYRDNNEHISEWGPRSELQAIIRSSSTEENTLEGFSTEETIKKCLELLKVMTSK